MITIIICKNIFKIVSASDVIERLPVRKESTMFSEIALVLDVEGVFLSVPYNNKISIYLNPA